MSWPSMRTVPAVGSRTVPRIRIVVVFPAPFGPRKPNTLFSGTVKETLSMARTPLLPPYTFVRPSTSIIDHGEGGAVRKGLRRPHPPGADPAQNTTIRMPTSAALPDTFISRTRVAKRMPESEYEVDLFRTQGFHRLQCTSCKK